MIASRALAGLALIFNTDPGRNDEGRPSLGWIPAARWAASISRTRKDNAPYCVWVPRGLVRLRWELDIRMGRPSTVGIGAQDVRRNLSRLGA